MSVVESDISVRSGAAPTSNSSRDRHLFSRGPKRVLALDGGGVRGVISIAFLERIEELLKEQSGGEEVRLCDHFDFVGGTSTGAIIASALALGMTTAELKRVYHELAPRVFRRSRFRIPILQAKFKVDSLRQEIAAIIGERTLDSDDLRTGLCIVAKRMDTGSVWTVANNPRAPYWETPQDNSYIGNRHYKLANLIRASTAAPTYFEPEMIPILGNLQGLFVDGGVSPHNNPALALFIMARLEAYGLNWDTGPDKLTVVSIGTGGHRKRLDPGSLGRMRNLTIALHALQTVMDDTEGLVLALMQWLGESPTPWIINSEWQALRDLFPAGPMMRFLRYDVRLEAPWLEKHLDIKLSARDLHQVRQLDYAEGIPLAYEIGRAAAEKQVKAGHWVAPYTNETNDPL